MSRIEQANSNGFLGLVGGQMTASVTGAPAWSALASSAGNYLGGVTRRA
jgi:hypothetical protein